MLVQALTGLAPAGALPWRARRRSAPRRAGRPGPRAALQQRNPGVCGAAMLPLSSALATPVAVGGGVAPPLLRISLRAHRRYLPWPWRWVRLCRASEAAGGREEVPVASVDCVGESPPPSELETPGAAVAMPCRRGYSSLYARLGHMKERGLGDRSLSSPWSHFLMSTAFTTLGALRR